MFEVVAGSESAGGVRECHIVVLRFVYARSFLLARGKRVEYNFERRVFLQTESEVARQEVLR